MGAIRQPLPVKLVIPMLSSDPELLTLAEHTLSQRFGPIDYRSPDLAFTHTDYYTGELGPNLLRRFCAFEKLIDPGCLAEIKQITNSMEEDWSQGSNRRINLDPGYITGAKLVLATTKNQSHRIYIGQGIYAEVTLAYRNKAFTTLPWTYPDYASEAYRQILTAIRTRYMAQLRALRECGGLTPQ